MLTHDRHAPIKKLLPSQEGNKLDPGFDVAAVTVHFK
jgi:hypothetical protein